jgi:integrase
MPQLTMPMIRTLRLPEGLADKTYFDDELPGFGVRIRASGAHRWVVMYDAPGGVTRRMTLGTVDSLPLAKARTAARDILAAARLGQDPAATKVKARDEARTRAAETIGVILPRYLKLKELELRPKTYVEVLRHLTVHGVQLHKRAMRDISLRDAAAFLSEVEDGKGRTTRNRTRASWATFYRWALGEGLVETNPFAFTNKAPENGARKRTPTLGELAEIWHAAGDGVYGQLIKLLMLTGARREEIASLSWRSEIDLANALVTLPGERTKNGREREIPITKPMRVILDAQRRDNNGRDQVFGRGDNGFQDYSGSKAELDQRIAAARAARGAEPLAPWTPHDFRRSLSTSMNEDLRIMPHVVEAVLGHVVKGVAGVYNKALYRDDKRTALERWNAMLMAAVNGKKGVVGRKRK